MVNEAEHDCGGIYLFEDEAAVQAFLAGPIVSAAQNTPFLSNTSMKMFDVLTEHTTITRGPVGERLPAVGVAKSFGGMVEEALHAVPALKAADLQRCQKKEPDLLVIEKASHFPWLEESDAFFVGTRAFLPALGYAHQLQWANQVGLIPMSY